MASEIKVDTIVNAGGDNDSGIDLATNDNIKFKIANSQKAIIDASGNVGIGTSTIGEKLTVDGSIKSTSRAIGGSSTAGVTLSYDSSNSIAKIETWDSKPFSVETAGAERMRIDTSGNVLVGGTNNDDGNDGIKLRASGEFVVEQDDSLPAKINRKTSDGELIRLQKDGSTVGDIRCLSANLHIQGTTSGLSFQGNNVITPVQNGARTDNVIDLGDSSRRFDDIHATNGTIQTSDQNEKQDIASATAKELNVAKKLSALFKTFRWKDKVAEKGDKARTHTGIVAQEVQTAFSAEGLDASNYGLFTSDTWWEKEIKVDAVKADEEKGIEAKDAYTYMDTKDEKTEGYTERTRLGVRYPELFSFIFSSIEARLTALESK